MEQILENPCRWPKFSDEQSVGCSRCTASPIKGSLHKCIHCKELNLCDKCYRQEIVRATVCMDQCIEEIVKEHPDKPHVWRLVMSNLGKNAFPVHDYPCDSCGAHPFPGICYLLPGPDLDSNTIKICSSCYCELRHDFFEAKEPEPSGKETYLIGSSIIKQKFLGSQLSKLEWVAFNMGEKPDRRKLAKKIGFALFQSPTEVPLEELEEAGIDIKEYEDEQPDYKSKYGYSKEKEERIDALIDKLVVVNEKLSGKSAKSADSDATLSTAFLHIKFAFVSYFKEGWMSDETLPLIVMQVQTKEESSRIFLQSDGRVYAGWDDFLASNELPECKIVFPDGGIYEMEEDDFINLRIGNSRACKKRWKFLKYLDHTATGIGVVATVGSIIGLFTPLAPIAAAGLLYTAIGTGIYAAGRASGNLIDKKLHDESINPIRSKENFFSWFSVIASVASFGAMGASIYITELAVSGAELTTMTEFTVNAAIFSSLTLGGVGIVASGHNIYEKVANGEKPTPLELFQFAASSLFFFNSALTLQTAERMIEDTSKKQVNEMKDTLKTKAEREGFEQTIHHHEEDPHAPNAKAKTADGKQSLSSEFLKFELL
ncbi:hypothetical protein WR25_26224 isoform C [Diploscapter pachys]|uniref:DUF4781 domain-containing protein n=1 Tax=Diploscapter pachys TaxID=2018661 RepID=A0A2A2LRS2_9BILA|nr:hypothetical protein WR25_26224 isoform C [Diploscapter pachys]